MKKLKEIYWKIKIDKKEYEFAVGFKKSPINFSEMEETVDMLKRVLKMQLEKLIIGETEINNRVKKLLDENEYKELKEVKDGK